MEIRTFWIITIKLFGLWLFLEGIYILPQFITAISAVDQEDLQTVFLIWGALIVVLLLYCFIIHFFIFRTSSIITLFKLDKGFDENRIDIAIKGSTLMSIAVMVTGGLLFINNLPLFCKEVFEFFQQRLIFNKYPKSAWMIFYLIKTVIGYLLLTNNKAIVSFIKKGV